MTESSWYRRFLFNYKGNREYTRTGFEAASARFVSTDLEVDCSDRHFMITGSNSGIGLQTALEVAKKGGIIHMVCRNKESATRARSEIITTTGNDKIHLHIVDLAKPREVIVWAQQFAAQHERLDVLVHNAGCMVHQRKIDEDGIETNFAVNTLAIHILTLTFLPLLQRSEEARVVMVSSAGLLNVRLDPLDLMHANLEPFTGTLVYSQNKRQQVVMTLWYAQHYSKVHFSSMHPGWADTPAVRTSIPQFYEMMKGNLRSPAQGADTVVWLAISKAALKHPSGLFFQDREPVSTHFPLAWTKSSIEEEDVLVNKIQEIYSQIFNKIGAAASSFDPVSASSTKQPSPYTTPEKAQHTTEQNESTEHAEKSLEHPLVPEPEPSFPVLPPPPAPAEKALPVKSEVQEVAEIHAPPATPETKTSTVETRKDIPESSEELKSSPSPPVERKTDSVVEEEVKSTLTDEKEEMEDSKSSPSPPMERKLDSVVDEEVKSTTNDEKEDSKLSSSPPMERKTDTTLDEEVKSTTEEKEGKALHDDDDDDSSTTSIEHAIPEP